MFHCLESVRPDNIHGLTEYQLHEEGHQEDDDAERSYGADQHPDNLTHAPKSRDPPEGRQPWSASPATMPMSPVSAGLLN
jgi:hypothetical protein